MDLTIRCPPKLNETSLTTFECPLKVRSSVPVVAPHSLSVLSKLTLMPARLLILHAIRDTRPVCGSSELFFILAVASKNLIVLPAPALTIGRPSGLKARLTGPKCPWNVLRLGLDFWLKYPHSNASSSPSSCRAVRARMRSRLPVYRSVWARRVSDALRHCLAILLDLSTGHANRFLGSPAPASHALNH